MKIITGIAIILGIIMLSALIYGFGFGGGWDEVRVLMDSPWFVVSLVDVYVGFILFACWIGSREKPLLACVWILLLMTLGNLIACIYVVYAIAKHRSPPLAAGAPA